jgi:hypothetical protein
MTKRYTPILFALVFVGAAAAAGAQTPAPTQAPMTQAPTMNETPQQNVKSSAQYDQLTCANKAFRANRIAKECGPLQGSQFYDNCVASFDCGKQPSAANWRKAPPSETTK